MEILIDESLNQNIIHVTIQCKLKWAEGTGVSGQFNTDSALLTRGGILDLIPTPTPKNV